MCVYIYIYIYIYISLMIIKTDIEQLQGAGHSE